MRTVLVGRRRYSDPDVISLIEATGQLVDPRSSVLTQARKLNEEYGDWEGDLADPLKRLAILASIRGYKLQEMDRSQAKNDPRDAVVMPTNGNSRGIILYNPTRPRCRVAFSIAHEIAHTFFPNSLSGARFRSICAPGSRQARELEALCDLAGSELLMPAPEFLRVTSSRMGFDVVEPTSRVFGSSYEATVFRLATTYQGFAAAGLLRYRRRLGEERTLAKTTRQQQLFEPLATTAAQKEPKYRRQSFFTSELSDADEFIVRWNKSFDVNSCVYQAGAKRKQVSGSEALPSEVEACGNIEAVPAPYQRDEADPNWPDVLFLWWN